MDKQLNSLIVKCMPQKHVVNSTYDFRQICKALRLISTFLTSLDVEFLFANVPVKKTRDIILRNVYGHSTILAPDIPKTFWKNFVSFYMCSLKSQVFEILLSKLRVYCRYVDYYFFGY